MGGVEEDIFNIRSPTIFVVLHYRLDLLVHAEKL